MPAFGALLYDWLAGRPRTMAIHFAEVARDLGARIERGRLLDVGTGPGRLLREIHNANPAIELYGLDISPAMVRRAKRNLVGVAVDLRAESISHTTHESDFFDLVTATGSFYLWGDPAAGLREIHRILVPGGSAHLFEPDAETSEGDLRSIGVALRREMPLRRLIGPIFIRTAVKAGLKASELAAVLDRSPFAGSSRVERVTLAGISIWLHLALTKTGGQQSRQRP
jgi:SAM-dependent methyltransferase